MKDDAKTKKQLIAELQELRRFLGEILQDYNYSPDFTDLNLLKETFRQVKKSQEKFMKAFLHNALPMALTSHKDGCFVDVNDAFLRISGFKRDDIMGCTVTELGLVTPEQRIAVLDKLNSKGRIENFQLQIKLKNGRIMQGLLNVILMTLGKEKYRLIVVADVTDRHQDTDAQAFNGPGLCALPIDRPMPWFMG